MLGVSSTVSRGWETLCETITTSEGKSQPFILTSTRFDLYSRGLQPVYNLEKTLLPNAPSRHLTEVMGCFTELSGHLSKLWMSNYAFTPVFFFFSFFQYAKIAAKFCQISLLARQAIFIRGCCCMKRMGVCDF